MDREKDVCEMARQRHGMARQPVKRLRRCQAAIAGIKAVEVVAAFFGSKALQIGRALGRVRIGEQPFFINAALCRVEVSNIADESDERAVDRILKGVGNGRDQGVLPGLKIAEGILTAASEETHWSR